MKCPGCDSKSLRRSRKTPMEQFICWILPIIPYRCQDCSKRYWFVRIIVRNLAPKITVIVAVLAVALFFLIPFLDNRQSDTMTQEVVLEEIQKPEVLSSDTSSATKSKPSDSIRSDLKKKSSVPRPKTRDLPQDQGRSELQPADVLTEELKQRPNADIGPKDSFETAYRKPLPAQTPLKVKPLQKPRTDVSTPNEIRQFDRQVAAVDVPAPLPSALDRLKAITPEDLAEARIPGGIVKGPKVIYFSIHLESFKDFDDAKSKAVELMSAKGLQTWLRKVRIYGKDKWFRVYVGKQRNKAEAIRFGNRLKRKGVIENFYVHRIREPKPGAHANDAKP